MTIPRLRHILFPIVLATFALGGLEASGGWVIPARWVLTGCLAIYVLTSSAALKHVNSLILTVLLLYASWCLTTYIWSQAPQLTLLKAGGLLLVMFSMLLAGQDWADRHRLSTMPRFMGLVLLVAFFAGLSNPSGFSEFSADRQLYRGATGNPNFMAVLAATAMVPAFWYVYRFQARPFLANFWRVAVLALLVPLYLTNSRAGLLIFLCIFASFEIAKGLARNAFKVFIGFLAVLLMAVAMPDLREAFIKRNVYKESDSSSSIFYSRSEAWKDSYEAANKGGWLGAGYGVSIGANAFAGGLTAVGYGREKGNTQLAIVEETGVVGLILYLSALGLMFRELITSFMGSSNLDAKVLLALLTGALMGLTVQSFFEAWWVAPGSLESALFWSMMGVALGLARRIRQDTAEVSRWREYKRWAARRQPVI